MIVRFAALSLAGLITPSIVTEGLLLTPLVFLGTWVGTNAFRRSTPKGFYLGLQILLFAGAVGLIAKGLGQL